MSEAAKGRPKNLFYYVNVVIMFVLMFGIPQLPTFGQVTPLGMQILGIFVATLYGWCTVSLIWPSLLAMIAVGCTEYCTIVESFSIGFGNEIPLTIIVLYTLVAYLEESGLSAYMANWFISRKVGEGRPWVFTGLIFAAAYVMSAFVSLYATILLLWAIFYKICDQIGEQRRSKYTAMVIAGIVIICGLTGLLFPFKAFSVIMLGMTQKATAMTLDVNFFTWTLYNFVISVAMILLYLLACKFILRPDMSKVKDAGAKYAHLRNEKMNTEQKFAAVILLIFVIGLMLPSIFSKTIPAIAFLSKMGIIGLGTVCLIGLALVKTKEGKPYIDITKMITNGVNWELIILISATMPLCNALEADSVGILATVLAWMTATFSGLSGTMFMVAFTALFLITTQVTHNLVLILVFTPVLTKMGLAFGVSPLLVMTLIFYAAMTAYATPAASSNAALIFGNNEWVATKDAYLLGVLILIIAFIVLLGIGIPLGNLLF